MPLACIRGRVLRLYSSGPRSAASVGYRFAPWCERELYVGEGQSMGAVGY